MNFTVTENTISALDRLQKDLRDLIESLAVEKTEPKTAPAVEKTEQKPATTLEEVRKVLVAKAREGKNDAVRGLLERFHAASLPEVDPADYADLLELGKDL